VLDALAGGDLAPEAFVDAIVAPVDRDMTFEETDAAPAEATQGPAGLVSDEQTADEEQPASAFGPRLSPTLEPCHAGAFGRLSDSTAPAEDSPPVADGAATSNDHATADGELAADADDMAEWLGRTTVGTPSVLALAEELDAQINELQDELMTAVDGVGRWPQDTVSLAEPVGEDSELIGAAVLDEDGALVTVDTPEPPSPTAKPPARNASSAERPTASAAPTPGKDSTAGTPRRPVGAGSHMDSQEENAPSPQTSSRSARTSSKFGGWWRSRGRPTDEALRAKRQEAFRKALAKRQDGSEASPLNRQQANATMTRSSNIDWKPGDPFAGRRKSRNRQFRWQTMLLTAGGIAGVGYAALRVLLLAGKVGG